MDNSQILMDNSQILIDASLGKIKSEIPPYASCNREFDLLKYMLEKNKKKPESKKRYIENYDESMVKKDIQNSANKNWNSMDMFMKSRYINIYLEEKEIQLSPTVKQTLIRNINDKKINVIYNLKEKKITHIDL